MRTLALKNAIKAQVLGHEGAFEHVVDFVYAHLLLEAFHRGIFVYHEGLYSRDFGVIQQILDAQIVGEARVVRAARGNPRARAYFKIRLGNPER